MKKILFIAFVIFLSNSCTNTSLQKTENLFMPKEIKQAYEKGTRSYDGKPGKNYFINQSDYKIKAEFNPETRILNGNEKIKYKNNSPDTLSAIYFNLYQDLFKKGNARDWDLSAADIYEGVDIKFIKIRNKETAKDKIINKSSVLKIILSEFILPGEALEIEIEWSFILPKLIPVRNGTYEDDNFFIGYWYPKIAVYDDITGWNNHGYTGRYEFYNDFGNFDLEITVPGEYNVWSSGILQNANKILNKKYFERLKKSQKTSEIIKIITPEDRKNNEKINKSKEKHTWKFKAKNLPDFSFALSKSYLWDATMTKIGRKKVFVNAVYKQSATDFFDVCEISKKIIEFYSFDTPEIEFPYPQMTAFNGGGGMEFPGMINDGKAGDMKSTIYLTAHEIGHTYFPFYTGLNEQKYAWMDEGLISFFSRLTSDYLSDDKSFTTLTKIIKSYEKDAGTFIDIPQIVSSESTGKYAYRFHAYVRPAAAFLTLYDYLGKEKFNKCLQEFTNRWKGKHPTPFDFFFTFNEIAEEDLAWFWKPWFFDFGYADLSLEKIDYKNDSTIINIEKKGNIPVNVKLEIIYENDKKEKMNLPASIWKNNNNIFPVKLSDKIKKVILDTKLTPDANPDDNILIINK